MPWYSWIALLQFSLAVLGGIVGWRGAGFDVFFFIRGPVKVTRFDRLKSFAFGWAFVATILLLADALIVASPYAHQAYVWSMKRLGLQVLQLLIGGGAILAGCWAYWFKGENKYAYGVVEIIFAGAAAIAYGRQMARNPDWAGSLAGLGGAIYVVSRGLGNCHDAREEAEKKRKAEETAQKAQPRPEATASVPAR